MIKEVVINKHDSSLSNTDWKKWNAWERAVEVSLWSVFQRDPFSSNACSMNSYSLSLYDLKDTFGESFFRTFSFPLSSSFTCLSHRRPSSCLSIFVFLFIERKHVWQVGCFFFLYVWLGSSCFYRQTKSSSIIRHASDFLCLFPPFLSCSKHFSHLSLQCNICLWIKGHNYIIMMDWDTDINLVLLGSESISESVEVRLVLIFWRRMTTRSRLDKLQVLLDMTTDLLIITVGVTMGFVILTLMEDVTKYPVLGTSLSWKRKLIIVNHDR